MAKENTSVPEAAASQAENLQAIKGIGPAAERRLHGAGIHTYAQLAGKTHEQLYQVVKGSRPALNLAKLTEEDWPGHARALMDPAEVEEGADPSDGQHSVSFLIELLLEADDRVRRTTIKHVGSDDELPGPGWDVDRMLGFMARYAELRSAALETPPEPAAAESAAEPEPEAIEPTAEPEPPAGHVAPTAQARPALAVVAAARQAGSATPSAIIHAGQDWIVGLEWTLSGAQEDVLDETWLIEVHLESMGPGREYTLPIRSPAKKPLRAYDQAGPAAGTYRYTYEIDVPANTIAPGRYLVVPTVYAENPAGKLGPITGFGAQDMLCLQ